MKECVHTLSTLSPSACAARKGVRCVRSCSVADRDARRMPAVIGILQIAPSSVVRPGVRGAAEREAGRGRVPLRAGGYDLLVSRTRRQRQRRTEPRCQVHIGHSRSPLHGVGTGRRRHITIEANSFSSFSSFLRFFVSSVETLASAPQAVPVPMSQDQRYPQFRHVYLFPVVRHKLANKSTIGRRASTRSLLTKMKRLGVKGRERTPHERIQQGNPRWVGRRSFQDLFRLPQASSCSMGCALEGRAIMDPPDLSIPLPSVLWVPLGSFADLQTTPASCAGGLLGPLYNER